MHAAVLGAGPAGLLFALLARRRFPRWRVEVFEQNPAGATFGFGVVFSQGALQFLDRVQVLLALHEYLAAPHVLRLQHDQVFVSRNGPAHGGADLVNGRQ